MPVLMPTMDGSAYFAMSSGAGTPASPYVIIFADMTAPVARFTYAQSGSSTLIDLDASTSTAPGVQTIVAWNWYVDGSLASTTGPTEELDLGDYLPHVVGLRVRDSAGVWSVVTEQTITLHESPGLRLEDDSGCLLLESGLELLLEGA